MLQNIGDKIKGWVAGVVIALIGASFMLWGVGYYFTDTGHHNEAVVSINGKKIGKNELAQRVNQLKNLPGLQQVDVSSLQQLAISQLVNEQLWSSLALKSGFAVDDRVMGERIASHPSFQVNGTFSSERFNQFLYQMRLTPGQFGAMLKQQMLVGDLNQALLTSMNITPAQLNVARQLVSQKRDIRYVMIDAQKMRSHVHAPDQKMIQAYYNDHQKDFYSPEKVRLSYILLSPKTIQNHIEITDEQVKREYLEHRDTYKKPKQWQVEVVRTQDWSPSTGQVKDQVPQSLQQLAQALSSGQSWDLATKASGLVKTQASWSALAIDASTMTVLSSMKTGDISAPFKTPNGWQMIKLDAIIKAQPLAFLKVKAGIKKSLVANELAQKLSAQADVLANETYTNPDSLKMASSKLNLPVLESPWLEKTVDNPQLPDKWRNPLVLKAAFSQEVLKDKNNSQPITLKNGDMIVLRVMDHQEGRLKSIQEVAPKIAQILAQKSAQLQANLLAQAIKAQLMQKKSVSTLFANNQLTWKNVMGLQPMRTQSLPNSVQEAVFTVQAKLPSVVISVSDDGEIYVVQILKVTLPTIMSLDSEKDARLNVQDLKKELVEQKNRMFTSLLQRELYNQSSIKLLQPKK